jgi:anhydro-N-acetylmuramic acid kinase
MTKSERKFLAIGLMSGTSMDGVDSSIIETDGQKILDFKQNHFKEYPGWLKLKIRKLISDIQSDNFPKINKLEDISKLDFEILSYIKEVEKDITKLHVQTVEELIISANLRPKEVDVIGFHGHTIDHRPQDKFTWQIGDGDYLAKQSKIKVVANFRENDIKLGGQGAPLLPLYHKAVINEKYYPACVLNIGGVSNITYIDENNLIAFDTGPGNALIDDIIFEATGKHFDEEGKVAKTGSVNNEFLNFLCGNLYFSKKPPKSLDRNQFALQVKKLLNNKFSSESFANKVASLSEFTVQAVLKSVEHLPQKPKNWFVCGGGVHNKYFMERFKSLLEVDFYKINKANKSLNPDFIEAQGFAFLAVRSLLKLPLTFASTTGVASSNGDATGGVIFEAV